MNTYSEFIAKSRYSRYLPLELRREHWDETTDRWISFFKKELEGRLAPEHYTIFDQLREVIHDLEVLPSMRSIMTAGPALDRTHVAAYNCAYTAADDPRVFDETLYILMCGTGVGFSVEHQYVSKLPRVPAVWRDSSHAEKIVVEDSKEGWAKGYRELIRQLYTGILPVWDLSQVRPAGAPLKTTGGRSSGPEPLHGLFEYTVSKFLGCQGEQLDGITVHDILCKIGEVVVVGGVRRSAMISLGDRSDINHALAKSNDWWIENGHRALANNSAVYMGTPDMSAFMEDWVNLYKSRSGERGIFNRHASQDQAAKWGRRDPAIEYGTNPCSEIILRPNQFCNLTTTVIRPDDDFDRLITKVFFATVMGTMQATLTKFPEEYLRPIWKENTEAERLLGVSMTGIFDNPLLNGQTPGLEERLRTLRNVARATNQVWAQRLGINEAAAITCVKPEGTVSQLTLSSSGIHPGYAKKYIRRVRQDNKDPLTQFLKNAGVPNEPCVMKPDSTTIFSFPQEANGITRHDITALEHLELWLTYQRHYCEHKPSVTISVKEHEWMEVGAWVYKYFDECTGVSFLPDDGGTSKQAPYEDITEEQYNEMLDKIPSIDWNDFQEFDDQVEGAQTLACVSGLCSI